MTQQYDLNFKLTVQASCISFFFLFLGNITPYQLVYHMFFCTLTIFSRIKWNLSFYWLYNWILSIFLGRIQWVLFIMWCQLDVWIPCTLYQTEHISPLCCHSIVQSTTHYDDFQFMFFMRKKNVLLAHVYISTVGVRFYLINSLGEKIVLSESDSLLHDFFVFNLCSNKFGPDSMVFSVNNSVFG